MVKKTHYPLEGTTLLITENGKSMLEKGIQSWRTRVKLPANPLLDKLNFRTELKGPMMIVTAQHYTGASTTISIAAKHFTKAP